MYFKKIISVLLTGFFMASACALPAGAARTAGAAAVAENDGVRGDTIGEGDVWDDDGPGSHATVYNLHVNGEYFTSEKLTVRCGNGTAAFDPAANMLTLRSAELSRALSSGTLQGNAAIGSGLSALTVVFEGKTTCCSDNADWSFLCSTGKVTFTGTGTAEMVKAENRRTAVPIDVNGDIVFENTRQEQFVVSDKKSGDLLVRSASLADCVFGLTGDAVFTDTTLENCQINACNALTMQNCTVSGGAALLAACDSLNTLCIPSGAFDDSFFARLQQDWFGDGYLPALRIYVPAEQIFYFKRSLPAYNRQIFADGAALLGDADGDGSVKVQDVTAIQQMTAEYEAPNPDIIQERGDVNGDGVVNIADATLIQKHIAEYSLPYPVGKPLDA